MADWTADLESIIFNAIKEKAYNDLSEEFPNIYFTTVASSDTSAKFPTCYIHLLPMVEEARDMRGMDINAVLATFQVDVTTNTTKADCRTVIYELIDCLKSLQFELSSMPEFSMNNDVHRAVARARRRIGSSDILNLNI